MIIRKSKEELNRIAMERLANHTDITNISPGGRATLLLEIFNETMNEFYSDLESNIYMSFVSSAEGQFLDWIGELVDCERTPGENDNNYRYRITQQVYVAQGANRTAIRLRALSVDGVRDVVEVPYTMGTGSFSVYVIPDDPLVGGIAANRVQEILEEYQSFGIRGQALLPKEVEVSMEISLILDEVGQGNAVSVRRSVQREVRDYIEAMSMGDPMIMVDLISRIKGASNSIRNFKINRISVNNRPILVQDYRVQWDEKLSTSISNIIVE